MIRTGQRLDWSDIERLFREWPDDTWDLALALRDFILESHPHLGESIAFKALCYTKPNHPYCVIGGNVCMLAIRSNTLQLPFQNGVHLPDPDGLLLGKAKAKRHINIHSSQDINLKLFARFIRDSIAYEPKAR